MSFHGIFHHVRTQKTNPTVRWTGSLLKPHLKGIAAPTLPETNIAPENRPAQKETSIPTIHFQVLC